MNRILLSFFAVMLAATLSAQTRDSYDAAVNRFQAFYNQQQTDSIYNMLSEKAHSAMTPEKAKQAFTGLHAQYGDLKSFVFDKQDGAMALYITVFERIKLTLYVALNNDNRLENFRFAPVKEPAATNEAQQEKSNFIYKASTGDIYGTLTMPASDKKVPVVLIIAGSGPTDRDCNSSFGLKTNAFLMLADSLRKAGIASLRYDKRGVGASSGAQKDEEHLSFEDFISDAAGIIKKLKEDTRFSAVYVLGHSEGSLIGMIAARKEKVAGYISLAGPGEPLSKTIVKQYSVGSKETGHKVAVIVDSINNGYTVKKIDDDMMLAFHPSIQPYLRSVFKYDPSKEVRKLTVPVLILQGTTDLQVLVADAQKLKEASPKATMVLIKGMNHPLKQAPEDREQNFATYNDTSLPLSAGLVPPMVAFIKAKHPTPVSKSN